MQGFKPRSRPAKGGHYADGGVVNPLAGVGEYWSQSNADFEAQDPSLLQRGVRALNPMTGFGSALGAMYDGASNGSATDMGIAAMQAFPVFGSMRAVAPTLKAAGGFVPSIGKTIAAVAGSTSAGIAADDYQAQNLADGGMVRGPGTGTSDDVKKKVKPGSYIMPADSTKEIGEEVMQEIGEPMAQERTETLAGEKAEQRMPESNEEVPVNLSNGEYELPPEQVHAIGVQMLDHMKNKTHTPVAKQSQGFQPEAFFANGGEVDDPAKRPTEGFGWRTKAVLQGGAEDVADAANKGQYAKAFGTGERALAGTIPAIGMDVGEAALSPVVNFGKGLFGIEDTPAPAAAAVTAAPKAAPVSEPVAASPTPAVTATAAPAATEAPAQPAAQPGVGNVIMTGKRASEGGGASYSGSNIGENFTINGQQPRGGFMVGGGGPATTAAASAPTGMGFRPEPQVDQGSRVVVLNDTSRNNDERRRLIDAASTPLKGSPGGQLTANQLRTLAGIQEADQRDATARYTTDANNQSALDRTLIGEYGQTGRAAMANDTAKERTAIDQGQLDLNREAQGFKTRASQREEKLYQQYDAAKTPEERSAIAQSIRDLSGKSDNLRDNFMTVGGGQEYDQQAMTMRNVPQRLIDLRTGNEVGGGDRAPPPIDQNPAALAIKNNSKLSREERVAQLRALGYQ